MRAHKPPAKIKGVAALLGDDEPQNSSELPLEQIRLPVSQPRRHFDPEKLEQLITSIQEKGILEPLLVRPLEDGYELVAGERRYRAAITLNFSTVPVAIKELTDSEALEVALIENLQREDLNPIEETEGVLNLLSIRLELALPEVKSTLRRILNEDQGKVTSNVTSKTWLGEIETILMPLGIKWKSFVTNKLPLLDRPEEVLEAVRDGRLDYTKAKVIARVKDDQQRFILLEKAIIKELSLSEIKTEIAPPIKPKESTFKSKVSETLKLVKKVKVDQLDPKKQRQMESYLDKIQALLNS